MLHLFRRLVTEEGMLLADSSLSVACEITMAAKNQLAVAGC